MMNPTTLQKVAIAPAMALLPTKMIGANRLLTAIAIQESGLRHRFQQDGDADDYDDAIGWWQFERIGIAGVETHFATKQYAADVRGALSINQDEVYYAMRYNDVLAAAYARLLLWRHPDPLPLDQAGAEAYYLSLWRPGSHEADRWERSWAIA